MEKEEKNDIELYIKVNKKEGYKNKENYKNYNVKDIIPIKL